LANLSTQKGSDFLDIGKLWDGHDGTPSLKTGDLWDFQIGFGRPGTGGVFPLGLPLGRIVAAGLPVHYACGCLGTVIFNRGGDPANVIGELAANCGGRRGGGGGLLS